MPTDHVLGSHQSPHDDLKASLEQTSHESTVTHQDTVPPSSNSFPGDDTALKSTPSPQVETRHADQLPFTPSCGNLAFPNEAADTTSPRPTVPTQAEVASSLSPNSSSVHVRVSAIPKRGVVTVELRLGEGVTADGGIKDVEFLFNIEQDNYEVSAPLLCPWRWTHDVYP